MRQKTSSNLPLALLRDSPVRKAAAPVRWAVRGHQECGLRSAAPAGACAGVRPQRLAGRTAGQEHGADHIRLLLREGGAAKDGDLRVIDESSQGYLYPADLFVRIIRARRPTTSAWPRRVIRRQPPPADIGLDSGRAVWYKRRQRLSSDLRSYPGGLTKGPL